MLPQEVPPAVAQLPGHVPTERHLLPDSAAEDRADLQARHGLRATGEPAQGNLHLQVATKSDHINKFKNIP